MARLLQYSVVMGWLAFSLVGCDEPDLPYSYEPPLSPYEGYKRSILEAKIDSTAMGFQWLQAGEMALYDSSHYQTPFREMGFFRAERPTARGFRILPKLGQEINVQVANVTNPRAQIFLDIFEEIEDSLKRFKRVISADSVLSLKYEVANSRPHIIRLQPELLVSTSYTVSIVTAPSLAFPVSGKNYRAIGSVWGDPRDGGRRRHEGIDIFAKRGTPVVASSEGRVSFVGVRGLGGKVVWLRDNKRRQSLYYAHLDSQMVSRNQRVKVGDTLGLVGNTGNARSTPPHLHFGIYRSGRGAVDPYPHVRALNQEVADIISDTTMLGFWMTATTPAKVYEQASTRADFSEVLQKTTPFYVLGAVRNWYRVVTPAGEVGYVRARQVGPIKTASAESFETARYLGESPDSLAMPIDRIDPHDSVTVLGNYGDFALVETSQGLTGWLLPEAIPSTDSALPAGGADQ